ncbi:hypothetical protein F5887DRAFT_23349 [Amanita rubescens]|nr:hypothetical protein F5887DRAFT_23349 [Amanita rubescens]
MDNAGWHAQRRADKEQETYRHLYQTEDGQYYPVQYAMPIPESSIGGSDTQRLPPPLPPRNRVAPEQLAHLSPEERSRFQQIARMDPPLQFMCGPLLKYDTVVNNVWYGAALIITADAGSTYSPAPVLTYEWDPDKQPTSYIIQPERTASNSSFELGPHPTDPHTPATYVSIDSRGQNARRKQVEGQEIYVYVEGNTSYTFWRFYLEIPLGGYEAEVTYHINQGQRLHFYVPGMYQNMRWAAYSCNGFSSGVNPDDFRGPGYQSGYDPLWIDLLTKHSQKPFHAVVGGGDQLYCDGVTREPELQDWLALKPEERKGYPLTDKIRNAISRYLFHHYCERFRHGAFARANSSIPMLNMCDDHDLIDGFGSYPDDLQRAPVFQEIGIRGYFFYLLFQCFINVNIDGVDDRPGQHIYKSLIVGEMGPYVQTHSHSFLSYLGPQCSILLLDCRAERTLNTVCSLAQYKKVFARLHQLPTLVEHLIVQLGIPIAYPRMVFLETALESKLNPLVALGRSGFLSGFVNKYNADAELLDDLNDHWTAKLHKQERNKLIEQFQLRARSQRLRITFVSGDVHCAAVGLFKTLKQKNGSEIPLANDYRYMVNIVTSAIVNTPPPVPVIAMVSSLATKNHKALHYINTDETMLPLFSEDTDGTQRKQKFIMGRRNWCQVDWNSKNGELVFDLRVEKEKGVGTTVSYPTQVPAPNWPRS